MTVKEHSGAFSSLKFDVGTIERLRVLAGGRPMASYLRDLVNTLAEGLPATTKELRGGSNMIPVKRQLDEVLVELKDFKSWMDNRDEWLKDMQKDLFKLLIMVGMTIKALEQCELVPQLGDMIYEQGRSQADALWQEFQRKQGWAT